MKPEFEIGAPRCPDCDVDHAPIVVVREPIDRRQFLKTVGAAAGAVALTGIAPVLLAERAAAASSATTGQPETVVKTLYSSLTPRQREITCMAWTHPKRTTVSANWAIVDPTIKQVFNPDQQAMIETILRGVTTDEWYPKLMAQMKDDSNGLSEYHIAIFGDPGSAQFEWVITGRHCTLRADGHSNANAAFGGPIFYGHAPKFTEDAGHPGNVYWYQGQQANAVFGALDGKQRSVALLENAPDESKVQLQGGAGQFPGIAIGDLTRDQKQLVHKVMMDLLAPYRPSDAKDVMTDIAANGGLDKIHLAFYKHPELATNGVWDVWRLEGPALVWHFRGAPHIHTWVNVAKDAKKVDIHTV